MPHGGSLTEKALVRRLRRLSRLIGDDCAVIQPPPRQDLLLATDFSIEGVHFTRETRAEAVGRRVIARGLSDIAAMGGKPLYCLISLALAPWTGQLWITEFYEGVMSMLKEARAQLAGGDISHAGQLVCDVAVCGSVAKGKALLRSGAKAGDAIYVSGALGGWRHRPEIVPRLDIGEKLIGKASACMDISDGLAIDLHSLCMDSGVGAALDHVPVIPGATLQQALHDGEDYELLYTAKPGVRVPGIRIGAITRAQPGALTLAGKPLKPQGYDHLRNRT